MEKNTQLPVEVVENIENKASEYAAKRIKSVLITGLNKSDLKEISIIDYAAGATAYATKLQELQQENASLKEWKHSALAILNPLWDYADKHLNVPLGEIKTEAMIKRIKELEHQNDKLKEKATGWRPLLEEVLSKHETGGCDLLLMERIKTFLYGE